MKLKSVYKESIKTFQDGKYKDLSLKEFCDLYLISEDRLYHKLRLGMPFDDAVLKRKQQGKYTPKQQEQLLSLGCYFEDNKPDDTSVKISEFKSKLQNGKFKDLTIREFLTKFHLSSTYVIESYANGMSMKDIFLTRKSLYVLQKQHTIKERRKIYFDLIALNVVFDVDIQELEKVLKMDKDKIKEKANKIISHAKSVKKVKTAKPVKKVKVKTDKVKTDKVKQDKKMNLIQRLGKFLFRL